MGLSLCRGGRDFSDGERQLLDQLQPLFGATLERLHELALLRAVAAGVEDDGWLLLVDADAALAWASPAANDGLPITVGEPVPAGVRDWLVSEPTQPRPARTTALTIDGLKMVARLVPNAYPGLDAINLRPLPRSPEPQQLRRLGLTRRQADILYLAVQGLTSPQIARRLTLSPRTVEHHFEAIYARLGVTNRSQAIATASGALNQR